MDGRPPEDLDDKHTAAQLNPFFVAGSGSFSSSALSVRAPGVKLVGADRWATVATVN